MRPDHRRTASYLEQQPKNWGVTRAVGLEEVAEIIAAIKNIENIPQFYGLS